jgi:ketosteroid isomerase-like protein
MRIVLLSSLIYLWSIQAFAQTDLEELGRQYFTAWSATQSPDATEHDLDNYLSLLNSDVAHQHLPYDADDSRTPDGKARIREGMLYYLGAHVSYSAQLNHIIPAHNAIAISYTTTSKGIHPQTKELVELQYQTLEVLEIEDGKVAVIRKYEE